MSNHNLWAFINPHKTLKLLLLIQNHRISEPQTYLRYDLNRKMFPLQESVGSILRLFFYYRQNPPLYLFTVTSEILLVVIQMFMEFFLLS